MKTKNEMKAALKPFYSELRKLGFKRDSLSHFSDGFCVIYQYAFPSGITVDVQLWSDGNHRASHMYNGRSRAVPTDFLTVSEMVSAIEAESIVLRDFKPGDSGN